MEIPKFLIERYQFWKKNTFENYKDLHDLKLIIVVQHPRQYALEVANQRSELPDSGLYLDILKEYVQLVQNLVAQCDSINLIKSG